MSAMKTMTERQREKMLKIVDGQPDLVPIAYFLTHMRRMEEMQDWLIEHKFTGTAFRLFYKDTCKSSPMAMWKFLIARLEKQTGTETRPVLYLRDYVR